MDKDLDNHVASAVAPEELGNEVVPTTPLDELGAELLPAVAPKSLTVVAGVPP